MQTHNQNQLQLEAVGDGVSLLHYDAKKGTILANHSNQSDMKMVETIDKSGRSNNDN